MKLEDVSKQCENIILNLIKLQPCENYLNTLEVITELMIQMDDTYLAGAEYSREFKHGRLQINVRIEKKYKK